MLHARLAPAELQEPLRDADNLFLEIGIDEELNHWPVELMYDQKGFLCLRHYIGRYVVSTMEHKKRSQFNFQERRRTAPKILLIAVADPEQGNAEPLSRVTGEASAIESLFAKGKAKEKAVIDVVREKDATYDTIRSKLSPGNGYDIIHFCGHASFDDGQPEKSKF